MSSNHIDTYLKTLSLHRISEIYLQEAENAANTKLSYQDYLLRLLEGISHEVSEGIPLGDGFAIKTQLHLENCRMGRCPVLSRRDGFAILGDSASRPTKLNAEGMDFHTVFRDALEQQVLSKIERPVNRKMQLAAFPHVKRLEEFDFSYQPKINEHLIRELASLNFLAETKNILFIGAPGVGKTHLAISIGVKAIQARKRVLFFTADQLTQNLAAAEASNRLGSVLDQLGRVDLLIIDELGYLSLSKQTAKLFFQLISKRYERGSIIVTSNKPFEQWGEIFSDDVVAAAILDRLLHHSYHFLINGRSYRMKQIAKPN